MGITLYKNADWILTVNEKREKFRHGDLLISGKEILDVGNDLEKKYAGKLQIDKTIDAKGTVILPGFVNIHHHTWQSLIRNIQATRGLKLEPWLTVMYGDLQRSEYRCSPCRCLFRTGRYAENRLYHLQ